MTEKSFLEILSEKIEKQLREEILSSKKMSNFQSATQTPNEKSTQNVDNFSRATEEETLFAEGEETLNNHQYNQWMSQIPLSKIHFQTPRNRIFGKVYPQNTPRPKPAPPRIQHVLTEKQKQSVVYFWSWQVRLAEDFTLGELKKAFRSLAHRLHPDHNQGRTKDYLELKAHYDCLLSVF